MRLKRGITLGLIIIVAVLLISTTSICFAETNIVSSTELSSTLEELKGVEIQLENLQSYLDSEELQNETESVSMIVKYNDDNSHDIASDLQTKGVSATVNYTYSVLLNGCEITMQAKDILSLSELSYIKSVTLSSDYYLDNYTTALSGTTTGVVTNDTAYKGEGMVVAVIDAGFDVTHEEYTPTNAIVNAFDKSNIDNVLTQLNSYKFSSETASSLYVSEKVVYAYDYANEDVDVYLKGESHGTHTSTTLAGSTSGVVPNAQLVLMKVAEDASQAISDGAIIAAFEDCYLLQVDVISMSIGSPCGFAEDSEWGAILESVRNAGITVIVSAGNEATSSKGTGSSDNALSDNVDNATIGSPGTTSDTYSVGSAAEVNYFLINDVKVYSESLVDIKDEYLVYLDAYNDLLTYCQDNGITNGELEYIIVYNGDDLGGATSDIEKLSNAVDGKIIVASKDKVSSESLTLAKKNGAIGCILIDGETVGHYGQSTMTVFPILVVSSNYKDTILANADSSTDIGTLKVDDSYRKIVMESYSSKGVNTDLSLGVDFVSYGSCILAGVNGGGYSTYTGTSMATPNTAGVYTAVMEYVKANLALFGIDENVEDLKEQISNVASKLIMSNTDLLIDDEGVLYSPRSQGAGLVNISDAISSESYIQTYDSNDEEIQRTKIELGNNVGSTFELKMSIVNVSNESRTYEINVDVLTEKLTSDNRMSGYDQELSYVVNSIDGATYTDNTEKWTVPVASGESKTITISITLQQSAIEELSKFANGIYIEGYVLLSTGNDETSLSTPFIGFYGDWESVPMLDITTYEETDENKAESTATTFYGIYAGSAYIAMGSYAFSVSDKYEGEKPSDNEEYNALSIYSSAMYGVGLVQLGLLRNAEHVVLNVIDNTTGEIVYSYEEDGIKKYHDSSILTAVITPTISTYSLGLSNNGKYTISIDVYRTYDEESESNVVSDNVSTVFYADYEAPVIDDIKLVEEGDGKIYADVTMYDNHYIQAIASCVGVRSLLSVSLSVLDVYPVTTQADGVGKTITQRIDVTDAYKSSTNGYIYFYITDYAFNYSVYYSKIGNTSETESSSNGSDTSDKNSNIATTSLEFKMTEEEISVNQEIDLSSTKYLKGYKLDQDYTWSTSNNDILAISNGKVTGLSAGVCAVTVTDSDSRTSTIIIKVVASDKFVGVAYKSTKISGYTMVDTLASSSDAFFGVKVSADTIELAPGEAFSFTYSYSPYNYNYIQNPVIITMESTNTSAVSVENNIIRAVSAGTSIVTVKAKIEGGEDVVIGTYEIEVSSETYVKDGVLKACFATSSTIDLSSETSIRSIGKDAFVYAENVEKIILPSTCVKINSSAFANNISIKEVSFSGVQFIDESAFEGCLSLTKIDLTGVKYIKDNAFNKCSNLTSVVIDTATLDSLSISGTAFANCTKLHAITVDGLDVENLVYNGELIIALNYDSVLSSTSITSLGSGTFVNYNKEVVDLSKMTALTNIAAEAFAGNKTIKKVIMPTSSELTIGTSAFQECSNLGIVDFNGVEKITVNTQAFAASSVATIDLSGTQSYFGDGVFLYCQNLKYVNLGSVQEMGKMTFTLDEALIKVVFENGSKTVGDSTFKPYVNNGTTYYCSSLKEVEIPDTITEIGDYVFAYCTSLTSINLTNVTKIGAQAFCYCSALSSIKATNVQEIGFAAFAYSGIQSAELGTSLTSGTLVIGEDSFVDCTNLVTVLLPTNNNVDVEIKDEAFAECSKLQSYSVSRSYRPMFPLFNTSTNNTEVKTGINFDRVTSIGDLAFLECEKLTTVELPQCTSIGYGAFAKCKSLSTIRLTKVESIGDLAFIQTALTNVTLPTTINYVGAGAFADNNLSISFAGELTSNSIVLDKVSNGEYAIYVKLAEGSYELTYYPIKSTATSYTIMSGTSYIGRYAMAGAINLKSISIPASVKTIGVGALFGCTSLTSVTFNGTTAPVLLGGVISKSDDLYCNFVNNVSEVEGLTLYVGSNAVKQEFKSNRVWSQFFSNISVSSEIEVVNPDSSVSSLKASLESFISAYGKEVTSSNYTTFEQIKAIYDGLSSEDLAQLRATDEGSEIEENYLALLSQYNELNIYTNNNDSTKIGMFDLPSWAVVLIIIVIAVILLSSVAFATLSFSRRMLSKSESDSRRKEEEIKKTQKDIIDIFSNNGFDKNNKKSHKDDFEEIFGKQNNNDNIKKDDNDNN